MVDKDIWAHPLAPVVRMAMKERNRREVDRISHKEQMLSYARRAGIRQLCQER